MRIFKRRRSAVGAVLTSAAATALFVLPASPAAAGTATDPNVCQNSAVPTDFSQLDVTVTGTSPASVDPGETFTLSGITASADIPGAIFVAGYNLGLLVEGDNTIPVNSRLKLEGTNTTQGEQNTNVVGGSPPDGSVTVTTTIDDPDNIPGNGDETATDATVSVSHADQTWTAGASGTINFREQSGTAFVANDGGLLINARIGGVLNVQFRCWPGILVPPPDPPADPNTPQFQDPATSFSSTEIVPPNDPPTADAGPDQTVASGATVNLNGGGSSDPDGDTLDFSWTQTGGTAVTLSGANTATPSFTAPTGPATLTFELEVCDQEPLCDTDEVTVNVNPPEPPVEGKNPAKQCKAEREADPEGFRETYGNHNGRNAFGRCVSQKARELGDGGA